MSDTPTIEHSAHLTGAWIIVPNFDLTSRISACSITNTVKRPTDIGVFRPALPIGWVDNEGAFDISQLAVEEAARVLGWRSPEAVAEETAKYIKRASDANIRYANAQRTIKRLEAQLEELLQAGTPAAS